jgi:hypothetical protein
MMLGKAGSTKRCSPILAMNGCALVVGRRDDPLRSANGRRDDLFVSQSL